MNSLYKTNEGFYAECIFKNFKELNIFKEQLLDISIKGFEQEAILDTLKKEEFVLD